MKKSLRLVAGRGMDREVCRGLIAAAALLGACAPPAPQVLGADVVRAEFRGAITALVPHYHPLYDPSEPPPPQLDPAFAARFAPGQPVVLQMAYILDAEDDVAASYWGHYAVDVVGSIAVDGLEFPLGLSVINFQTDQPYMPRDDQFFFHTFLNEVGTNPVPFSGIWLDAALYGADIVDSDALAPPPAEWDSTVGYMGFDTGRVWQTLSFSIDSVVASVEDYIAGDFNLDGVVDVDDLLRWQQSLGAGGGTYRMTADADGDLNVDGADFLAWQKQLGSVLPATGFMAPVPEPATFLLLIVAAARVRGMGRRNAY